MLRLLRSTTWLLLATTAAGCAGDPEEAPLPGIPAPPDVIPKEVPAAPEVLPATGHCTPLREGETLASVSPEGHAWLVVGGAESSSIRVLDAFDPEAMGEVVTDVALADVSELRAWSADDAAVVTSAGLWRLEDLARVELTPPDGFSAPAILCGDPSVEGSMLAGGTLFERRDDGWWGWDTGATGAAAPSALVTADGECRAIDDILWMTASDGTLWRVDTTTYSKPLQFAALVASASTEGMVAVLEADRLWIGAETWQPWVFPGAVPTALAAAGGYLWMTSGEQLLRFDGETFVEVERLLDEPALAIGAHAGGVWLVGESQVCHQATAPMIRVAGAHPFLRSGLESHDLWLSASDASAELSATVDGEALELSLDAETGLHAAHPFFALPGWHDVRIVATTADGESARDLWIKRVPDVERSWAADIEPIVAANCTGASCHHEGSTTPPDLGSYDAWIALADTIRTRVVEGQTMPPPANRSPEWGDDEIEIISQWLEGDMLP
jgi:hypothetical protein